MSAGDGISMCTDRCIEEPWKEYFYPNLNNGVSSKLSSVNLVIVYRKTGNDTKKQKEEMQQRRKANQQQYSNPCKKWNKPTTTTKKSFKESSKTPARFLLVYKMWSCEMLCYSYVLL